MLVMGMRRNGRGKMDISSCGMVSPSHGAPEGRSQKSVSIPTHQAEVYGLSETIREAIWLRHLLKDFVSQVGSLFVFTDNRAAISSTQNSNTHAASKHIDLRMKFNEEKVAKKAVKLLYVASENNVADVFTKPLKKIKFTKFRDMMLVEVSNEKLMN